MNITNTVIHKTLDKMDFLMNLKDVLNCAARENRLLHSQVFFDYDNEKPFDSPRKQSSLLAPGAARENRTPV